MDYSPYGRKLQKYVKSFGLLRDELEIKFGFEWIVMCTQNSIDELRPIRDDYDLVSLVSHLPYRGNLSITATGRKPSKQDLELRKFNWHVEFVMNQKMSIARELALRAKRQNSFLILGVRRKHHYLLGMVWNYLVMV